MTHIRQGYGGMLMDHFKTHIKATYPTMMHFLTYADNYAVGYFKKQGFSKDITLDRSVWAGYIKDYEGGTIMQCTMLRKVDYLAIRDILAKQREAIVEKIKEKSRSHITYQGLPQFKPGAYEPGTVLQPEDVPGLGK
jgi:histone acetyltransferase